MSHEKPGSTEEHRAARDPKPGRPYMPGYGIKAADEGEGLLPWDWAVERLTNSRGYWVSTVRPDGTPHCMAVWGIWIDNRFLFSTGAQSRKARNLAANPKCVISTDRSEQAVVVEGIVERNTDPELLREFCRAYQEKY
ncbi:MAG: pyridoxamine 5'-phosphate oxidase family protein, partial [Blastocatellia bacterium]